MGVVTVFKARREVGISDRLSIQRRVKLFKKRRTSRLRDWMAGKEPAKGMRDKTDQI